MSNIIDLIESEGIRKDIPDFQPGDTVRVFVKVVEGNRVFRHTKDWLSPERTAASAKRLPYVVFPTVSALNVRSPFIPRRSTTSR